MKLFKKLNDSQWLLNSAIFCVLVILVILPFFINNHKKVAILEKKLDSINIILYQREAIFKKRQKNYDEKAMKKKADIDSMKTEIIKQIK
ncbi:hypothetical protein ASF10_14120 [Flavobacterium sp. Leaf82]|uniref:hypothetical protein n=1 Tax=Flavobacterium sp. Leaf82 TaxID=1736238 RepID=UPI0006F56C30|nr:hypothetical protein [Flavobacterium sp. Leaf82]KQO21251.1 hypothetical protein ASF10_14120 [Flavobacterium sp. Leaf82]